VEVVLGVTAEKRNSGKTEKRRFCAHIPTNPQTPYKNVILVQVRVESLTPFSEIGRILVKNDLLQK